MDALVWCNHKFDNEETQKRLEEKVKMMLEGILKDKDDYQKEKAIKSFSEGLGYLEDVLMYQRNIHPSQLNPLTISKDEYVKQYKEVEEILKVEINRQYRHFSIFM